MQSRPTPQSQVSSVSMTGWLVVLRYASTWNAEISSQARTPAISELATSSRSTLHGMLLIDTRLREYGFPALNDDERAQLEGAADGYRARMFSESVELVMANTDSVQNDQPLDAAIRAILPMLSDQGPDAQATARVFGDWLVAFGMLMLACGDRRPAVRWAAASRLTTAMAEARGMSRDHLPAVLDDESALLVDGGNRWLALPWPARSNVELRRSDEGLQVRLADSSDGWLDASNGETRPVRRALGWDLPVYRSDTLGVQAEVRDVGSEPYPALEKTLESAFDILRRVWPEAIEWTRILAPGFGDLGPPTEHGFHTSTSFGPGLPLFLAQAFDPLVHAENIVHEVQHSRLHLLSGRETLQMLDDLEEVYVSPYRADPRPLRGLILGVHAFTAVTDLRWRITTQLGITVSRERLLGTHYMNLFSMQTILRHARLNATDRSLLRSLCERLLEQHDQVVPLVRDGEHDEIRRRMRKYIDGVEAQSHRLRNTGDDALDWSAALRMIKDAATA